MMTHPSLSPQPGIWGIITGFEWQSGKDMCQGGKPVIGKLHSPYIGMNVCGSACENGCVARACVVWQRIEYYYYLRKYHIV